MQASSALLKNPVSFENEMVNQGLITKDQLAVAEITQRTLGGDLGHILIQKGFIREPQIVNFFSEQFGIQVVDLKGYTINPALLRLIPYHYVQKFTTIPLSRTGDALTLAIADPFNLPRLETEIRCCEDLQFNFVMAPRQQIEAVIREHYRIDRCTRLGADKVEIINTEKKESPDSLEKAEKLATSLGTVAAVDSILETAYTAEASDIHFEPQDNFIRVRLRIDGLLEEKHVLPIGMHMPIISRIKIISGMNIAERRAPQDGRFSVKIRGKLLDCRTSTYPTQYGEKAVIRLLSKGSLKKLEQLGLSSKDREIFKSWILKPHGLILVTGPTGSGKSTTLYAALQMLNSIDRNIISIEDPIENEISGINQAQVNIKANLTFASALRCMLRQDPDVIMVGEVRDAETAEMVLRAALTGHLVLSTLHTNTAIGAISRLINLGIPPFLLASSLIGVLAQRLVRKNCPQCLTEYVDQEGEGRILKFEPENKLFRGQGCEACRHTGYTGRMGLFELLTVGAPLKKLIEQGLPEESLLKEATAQGFTPMIENGRTKILEGMTTLREVLRVTEVF
jgi:type IV pilus assembly protein PilB